MHNMFYSIQAQQWNSETAGQDRSDWISHLIVKISLYPVTQFIFPSKKRSVTHRLLQQPFLSMLYISSIKMYSIIIILNECCTVSSTA